MSGGFRFLQHTADAYIEAYGDTLEEAFEQAAKAMFEVMTDTSRVQPAVERSIQVEGHDLCSLLYNWLEELLFLFECEGLLFSKFKIERIEKTGTGYALRAKAWGEPYDPQRHESRSVVKAPTYHLMEVKQEEGRYILRFVLDL